jgi:hypothetical protein
MSNNKQSSVEWFQEQIIKIVNGTCELSEIEIFEQSKAMHKQEIKDAFTNGFRFSKNSKYSIADEAFYKLTYGGNE